MKLASLDLNLLLAFDTMLAENNVTRAAARLNISQPAMSGALARLRVVFGDRLFVRTGGHMRPTPRARQLAQPIGEAMATLREALERGSRFEPRHSTRPFVIAATDYVEALFAGSLVAALQREAPGVSLHLVRPAQAFVPPEEALRSGEADLALGLFAATVRPRPDLLSRPLLPERLVAVVRVGHPQVGRTLGLRAFLAAPQIRVVYPGNVSLGLIDTVLASLGHERRVALTVSHMATVPPIVARSDLLGLAPERLARLWARAFPLRVLELPVPIPDLPLAMVWHESRHGEAAHQWLRDLIARELTVDRTGTRRRRPRAQIARRVPTAAP
jgi:DNA-binding transcriptional LysR family regulator